MGEEFAEGLIDELRGIKGVEFAMTIREPPIPDGPARRISMRSTVDFFDVSPPRSAARGRRPQGAAGFSSDETVDEIIEFIRGEFVGRRNGA